MSNTPYAELLEFNQPSPIRIPGFTRIRDKYPGLRHEVPYWNPDSNSDFEDGFFYDPERIIEFAGRYDYDSAHKLGQPSNDGQVMITKWKGSGEESMMEMGEATFYIECSRIVSLELARHRHQERQEMSQRFVKFDKATAAEMFIRPPGLTEEAWDAMLAEYVEAFDAYLGFRADGLAPQDARYVLPGGFITKMVVKMNVRAWRHVLRLRLHKSAQPEMRELMAQIHMQLAIAFPHVFDDVLDGERAVR